MGPCRRWWRGIHSNPSSSCRTSDLLHLPLKALNCLSDLLHLFRTHLLLYLTLHSLDRLSNLLQLIPSSHRNLLYLHLNCLHRLAHLSKLFLMLILLLLKTSLHLSNHLLNHLLRSGLCALNCTCSTLHRLSQLLNPVSLPLLLIHHLL